MIPLTSKSSLFAAEPEDGCSLSPALSWLGGPEYSLDFPDSIPGSAKHKVWSGPSPQTFECHGKFSFSNRVSTMLTFVMPRKKKKNLNTTQRYDLCYCYF